MERVLTSQALARAGETVCMAGWVHNLRDFREVKFLILRDRGGIIQTVVDPSSGIDLEGIGKEFVVEVEGAVLAESRAPGGAEVRLTSLRVLAKAHEPPLEINRPAVLARTHLDKILDHRPISIRALPIRAIFRVQAEILRAFSEHLRSQGFTEFKSSKIVATGTEGGANLFQIDYFERKAYLAQSPQFYKQTMVGSGFERVFEVGPVYRAEKHETSRHVNEYTSLDLEMGFIRDEQDVIAAQVALMRHILSEVSDRARGEVELLGARVPVIGDTIPQLTFREAMERVERSGHRLPAGDLDPEAERRLSAWALEEHGSEFLYVVGFPLAHRPMYTHFREDDPTVSRSFDLLFRGLEITTGSQRIHDYDVLVSKMRERGLNPDLYEGYLSIFKHGMPPHGGLAIGLERLTMQILGLSNVKEATLFPRDRRRLEP
ncbi:MAG TPA: aspartate--tRNA(Asn) ligase [Planctomycetota bacterium]|nr:aspartate--tRNA(Asn) ligase [Planctomycetota bacterium]